MLTIALAVAVLAANPVLRTIATSSPSCQIIQRRAPDWKPEVLFEAPKPCPADSVYWSADAQRVLLASMPPLLIDLATKQLTTLPSPPKGTFGRLGFDKAGKIYALTQGGEGATSAWASRLEGDAWKVIEAGTFEISNWVSAPDQLHTATTLIKHAEAKYPRRAATPAELARLAAIPLADGYTWEIASAGSSSLAWQMTGTDACAFFMPMAVLTKSKVIKVPSGSKSGDTCRDVMFLGGAILITAWATPTHRDVVDLATGAVLASLTPEETSPRLLQLKP